MPDSRPSAVLALALTALVVLVAGCGSRGTAGEPSTSASLGQAHVWMVGGLSVSSSDAGDTWQRRFLGEDLLLTDVAFANELHGWAVGDDGVLLATADGGATWAAQDSGVNEELTGIACSDRRHAWATVWDGSILATTDGGATWERQRDAAPLGEDLSSIACCGTGRAWAAGSHGVILATADGGFTWVEQRRTTIEEWIADITFADERHGWAVFGETVLATVDGGTTWTTQDVGAKGTLRSVAAWDPTHAVVGGSNGEILVTTDGGRTWTAQKLRTKAELVDVAFTDSQHGWAMGTESMSLEKNRARTIVMSTADGGLTWSRRYSHVGEAWGFALAVVSAE